MIIDSESLVLQTLTGDAFVLVNKKIIRFFDGDGSAAIFLGEILSLYKYHLNSQSLDPDNSFPIPTRRIEYSLGFSAYKQSRILELLIAKNLCLTLRKDYPAQKYVIINFAEIAKILSGDELELKKADQLEFYERINLAFNSIQTYDDLAILKINDACDNMHELLKGTLAIVSKRYRDWSKKDVLWTPELVGKIRQWVRNRSLGKPFDFTIISRTIDNLSLGTSDFDKYVSTFIYEARSTPDVHFSQQKYDYSELLK